MKILHLETGRHLYGGALQVHYLMQGLAAQGIENVLVCPRNSTIAQVAAPSARVIATRYAGALDPRLLFRLRSTIRRERPDLVHVHSRRGAGAWGSLVVRWEGVPGILTRRVDNPEWPPLARFQCRAYRKVIAISEGIRQVLLGFGIPASNIACVPSAVDAQKYDLLPDRVWFRREFAIPENCRTIGVVAQLIERKGHRFLIEAAPEILREFPDTRFLFFGQGPSRRKLESACRRHGLARAIQFTGFRQDLPRILPCLDIVAHPALIEGLGVSLLQAAAAGVPLVGCRTGGIPEAIHDGVNGFLVPPRDSAALREALLRLLRDPRQARAFGEAGRALVYRLFSVPAMVAGNRRVYEEVLGLAP